MIFENIRPRNFFINAEEIFSRHFKCCGNHMGLGRYTGDLSLIVSSLGLWGPLLPRHTQEVMALATLHLFV